MTIEQFYMVDKLLFWHARWIESIWIEDLKYTVPSQQVLSLHEVLVSPVVYGSLPITGNKLSSYIDPTFSANVVPMRISIASWPTFPTETEGCPNNHTWRTKRWYDIRTISIQLSGVPWIFLSRKGHRQKLKLADTHYVDKKWCYQS